MPKMTTSLEDKELAVLIGEQMQIDAIHILGWVADTFEPEEVYDHGELEEWAERNGYVLKEG